MVLAYFTLEDEEHVLGKFYSGCEMKEKLETGFSLISACFRKVLQATSTGHAFSLTSISRWPPCSSDERPASKTSPKRKICSELLEPHPGQPACNLRDRVSIVICLELC